MLVRTIILMAAAFALTLPAEANGATKRKVTVQREVVRVYEPRPAPAPPPLVALGVLGTNLVIWEDLEVDLFDDNDPPPRVRQRYFERRIISERRERRGRRP